MVGHLQGWVETGVTLVFTEKVAVSSVEPLDGTVVLERASVRGYTYQPLALESSSTL
jgi:hypothetical protein